MFRLGDVLSCYVAQLAQSQQNWRATGGLRFTTEGNRYSSSGGSDPSPEIDLDDLPLELTGD